HWQEGQLLACPNPPSPGRGPLGRVPFQSFFRDVPMAQLLPAPSSSGITPPPSRFRCPEMSDETTVLLRSRLRSVSFILSGGFGLFLIQEFILRSWNPLGLMLAHVSVVLVLGVSGVVLSRPMCLSLKQLRWVELCIFGLPATFHVIRQYKALTICAQHGDPLYLAS